MPTDHPNLHFYATLGALGVTLALTAVMRNRVIRRRLLASAVAALGVVALHVAQLQFPSVPTLVEHGMNLEKVIGAFALINALVTVLFNPWFEDRISDRAPAIVQDAIIVALVVGASVLFLNNSSFLTGSAIAAAVIGFALQDTLGNLFAGLAIQIERPFRVGHWISVGSHEGMVTAVTWRATKIRTKAGNLVIVPNNIIGKESINNYSEPVAPTQLFVEVGVAYQTPPTEVRAAIDAVMRDAKFVLEAPVPELLLYDFAASSITYRVRFWIDDFSKDEVAKAGVRTGIYYEFGRRDIEIPYPIQVEYSRVETVADSAERRAGFAQAIGAVPVFVSLPAEAHHALAEAARLRLFGHGEVVVHEGDPGRSMFLVRQGEVRVVVGAEQREVAVTRAGGYFGEMSLLTGDPRTATVVARGDVTVLEIDADAFRAYITAHPDAIDALATAAVTRRHQLEQSRGVPAGAAVTEPVSLAKRMRTFFGLD
jgi:predicted outer membrane repeat protein